MLPSTQTHITTLSQLEENGDVDVWTKSRELDSPWDIMVKPITMLDVKKTLEDNQLKWKVLIEDVGR